ncbi:terminase family protein [Thalassobaculum sp. OXR-137]|uniref:terminase large subunit domain-containing protein n=1 Tax=Thalassobaculum sp. OXR-137 TaxID=3100173 RepID=UPI002AC898E3|nr:terminase family protein [Thalassobaculum sp. OXR-137]WPZ32229.1 terminase family protein [Thalassobaculum sp. OXR-137]
MGRYGAKRKQLDVLKRRVEEIVSTEPTVFEVPFSTLWDVSSPSLRGKLALQGRPDAPHRSVALIPEKVANDNDWSALAVPYERDLAASLEERLSVRKPIAEDFDPFNYNPVLWSPFSGSQMLFLASPVREVLFHGSRGTGKSDTLLMDFAQDVGRGWGAHLKGLIVRRTFPELKDLIDKSSKLFPVLYPGARYNASDHVWRFPGGEQLVFGYLDRPTDYLRYHGHEVTFLGFDELTSWVDSKAYLELQTTVRSPVSGIPLKIRATTNPSGPGHNWVMRRFIDKVEPGEVFADPETGLTRSHVFSNVIENVFIANSYLPTLRAIEEPNRRRAWLYGDWNVTAGGALDDLWKREAHVLTPFDVPATWRVSRSYDHGESSPGACLWIAESNGDDATMADGTKRSFPAGTLFVIVEYFTAKQGTFDQGLRLPAKEVATNIKEYERVNPRLFRHRVAPGPADNSIFDAGSGNSDSIAKQMAKIGVHWDRSDKSPGSRRNGLSLVRQRLKESLRGYEGGYMDGPGLFVFSTCEAVLATVPSLPRNPKDLDDVDTTANDHAYDALRYRVLAGARGKGGSKKIKMG